MRPKIVIGLLCIAAVLSWAGMAGAQTAPPAPRVQLPNGETVWNLEGLWEVVIENCGGGNGLAPFPICILSSRPVTERGHPRPPRMH